MGKSAARRVRGDELVGSHYADIAVANGLPGLYDTPTPLGELYRTRMHRIGALLAEEHGALLDAGCGTGQMLRFLESVAGDRLSLTGLDRSEAALDTAKRMVGPNADVKFVVGRIEALPFPSETFDAVLAMGSLEYVADLHRSLAELSRVLAPGGLAIVTMQNPLSPYRVWEGSVWSRIQGRRGIETSPIIRRVTPRRLRRMLSAAGLLPTSLIRYNFNVCVPPLDSHVPRLAMRLQQFLDRRAPQLFGPIAADYILAARRAR